MSNKTRVLHVRVVGFSAPERQMLNSIFLLSVAPARQIGYKLWNPETGVAPDMYLLDGDSDSAVASWQATFASTSDRTLVVGAKNLDLGVASASRPLGLKVVGAMDRLAIALSNVTRESAALDASAPNPGGTLPTSGFAATPKQEQTLTRATTGMTSKQPALSASMNAMSPLSPAANSLASGASASVGASSTMSASSHSMTASTSAAVGLAATSTGVSTSAATTSHANTMSSAMPATMTAAAPAATVLPNVTLQPNVTPMLEKSFDKSLNEKPVTEKTVDQILSDRPMAERPMTARPSGEKTPAEKAPPEKAQEKTLPPPALNLQSSGVTPLSPSALSAAVAPNPRSSLRVVPTPNPIQAPTPPLAASLPTAARIADVPMPPAAPPLTAKIADAPMQPPPTAPIVTVNVTPPAPVMPSSTAPTPRHQEHNFRVLAVDDSPLMRTFLQNKLAPYGINPEFAATGEEALYRISKQHYDLIFLDVMLPGMDGYDVCKAIKKNKDNALMKVVMLTSKDKTFDKIRGTMAGCDGYLTKPVDELQLRAIIERHSVSQK